MFFNEKVHYQYLQEAFWLMSEESRGNAASAVNACNLNAVIFLGTCDFVLIVERHIYFERYMNVI